MAPMRVIDVAATADGSGGFAATVNAGASRLKVGQKYDVVLVGEMIKDPASGEVLGRKERPCCTFAALRVDERVTSGAIDTKPVISAGEVLQVRPKKKD